MPFTIDFSRVAEASRSATDKRSVRVRLTDKSKAVCDRLRSMKALEGNALERAGIGANELSNLVENLRRLESAWSDFVRYRR